MADVKVTKEEHEKLKLAATMFNRLTGENIDGIVAKLSIANPEADKKAEAKAKEEQYNKAAEAGKKHDEAEQAHRAARAAAESVGR